MENDGTSILMKALFGIFLPSLLGLGEAVDVVLVLTVKWDNSWNVNSDFLLLNYWPVTLFCMCACMYVYRIWFLFIYVVFI